MTQNNKGFLQVGDVIELKLGMKVRADIPSKFIYSNSSMSNEMSRTDVTIGVVRKNNKVDIPKAKKVLEAKILDSFRSVCGAKPDSTMVQQLIEATLNNYQEEEFDTTIFAGEYLVVNTAMDGGSTGHDPYPDGHHVFCRKMKEGKYDPDGTLVDFYQSGCFTVKIAADEIQPVRKLTPTFI